MCHSTLSPPVGCLPAIGQCWFLSCLEPAPEIFFVKDQSLNLAVEPKCPDLYTLLVVRSHVSIIRLHYNVLRAYAGMGLALGGGIGYLLRSHGLTTDNIINATIVVANGTVVRLPMFYINSRSWSVTETSVWLIRSSVCVTALSTMLTDPVWKKQKRVYVRRLNHGK